MCVSFSFDSVFFFLVFHSFFTMLIDSEYNLIHSLTANFFHCLSVSISFALLFIFSLSFSLSHPRSLYCSFTRCIFFLFTSKNPKPKTKMAVYFPIYSDCNKKINFCMVLIILHVLRERVHCIERDEWIKKKTYHSNRIQKNDSGCVCAFFHLPPRINVRTRDFTTFSFSLPSPLFLLLLLLLLVAVPSLPPLDYRPHSDFAVQIHFFFGDFPMKCFRYVSVLNGES